MSEPVARPVSWFSVAFVFLGFALFFVVVWKVYVPNRGAAAYTMPAEDLPKDLAWKATPATRREVLQSVRDAENAAATKYDWADKAKGQVRLPIDRAMELTLRDVTAKKGGGR